MTTTAIIARWFTIPPSPVGTVNPEGARHAAHKAQLALDRERARAKQTVQATAALRELRERNHWADLLHDAMERE